MLSTPDILLNESIHNTWRYDTLLRSGGTLLISMGCQTEPIRIHTLKHMIGGARQSHKYSFILNLINFFLFFPDGAAPIAPMRNWGDLGWEKYIPPHWASPSPHRGTWEQGWEKIIPHTATPLSPSRHMRELADNKATTIKMSSLPPTWDKNKKIIFAAFGGGGGAYKNKQNNATKKNPPPQICSKQKKI